MGRLTRDNSDIIVQRECGGRGGGWGDEAQKILIYLFDSFHHDHTAKMLRKRKTFEEITRARDEGVGQTPERGSKLSVPLKKKINKYYLGKY